MSSQQVALESAIYQGFVRHRRFTPKAHAFQYSVMMILLKLDEVERIKKRCWQFGEKRFHWARMRREDYIGQANEPIAVSVKNKIAELLNSKEYPEGEVFLLGQLRYLGLYFSPLNLYYLRQQGHFRYMLAEVSNTPWNQRHYYLVDLDNIQPHDKAFHVSPFNPMQQRYHWQIKPPLASNGKSMLHLESYDNSNTQNPEKVFDATMVLKRTELNQRELSRVLMKTPIQTANIVMGIYWQALKLFLKRVPLHTHPDKKSPTPKKELS